MKFLLTALLLQLVDLTNAQSDCKGDVDTFDDGTGQNCAFYKGKDCLALARQRGISRKKREELLSECKFACGFCGQNSIVEQCADDSCSCKNTKDWSMTINGIDQLTCATHTSALGCINEVIGNGMSDSQIRTYFQNCAASCQVCRPCATILKVGDGFCDPGNNNDKCYRVLEQGKRTPTYDGGDCCNVDKTPFFEERGDNAMRYATCVANGGAYVNKMCKCLYSTTPARTKDCVGAFESKYTKCSVTCGVGVVRLLFRVLQPAQNGGKACQHPDGYALTSPCGRESNECPTTTAIPTTTLPPTRFSTRTTKPTIKPTTNAAGNSGSGNGNGNGNGGSGNNAGGSNTVSDGDGATTVTTMIMNIFCFICLFAQA